MNNRLIEQLREELNKENSNRIQLSERQLADILICECPEETPVHLYDHFEFFFQLEKSSCFSVNGQEVRMEAGDVLLINMRVPHAIVHSEQGASHVHLAGRLEFFEKSLHMLQDRRMGAEQLLDVMWENSRTPGYTHFRLQESRFLTNLIDNLVMAVTAEKGTDNLSQYTMGMILLYLSSKMEHATKDTSRSYKDTIITETLRYIDVQYRTANLSQIAEEFHQPLPVLSKMIKQETGLTFRELLMNKRFEKAALLLQETNLPVEKVAVNIGYENQSYFHLQFKKRYGVTPRQYRMQRRRELIRQTT